ncbi:MAG TPA: SDR family NAD(P)-dependent oxidoreductase [bacterium]|jgi:NAD(P)-dependent dehydrogenase (short-subunit alcohol dehydrogenase family)
MQRLHDKVALVTGGASGIGKAVAERFAAEGAAVCVADRDEPGARAVAEALSAAGSRALALAVDVTDAAAVQGMIERTVSALGGLHLLVTSAGIGGSAPLTEMPLELWQRVLAVNLTGTFLCTQAAAAHMIPQGYGRIVHLASAWGQRGVTLRTAYGASKGGVIAFMQAAAVELAPHGITVNAICPGPIDTPLVAKHHDAALRARVHDVTPIARYGTAAEVAAAAAYLASDEAAYVSGHQLNVDGGYGGTGIIFHQRSRSG